MIEEKAVDVVLLPEPAVIDEAIRLNKTLAASEIVLNKENCFPHISLAMGCINYARDIEEIGIVLERIVKNFPVGELQISGAEIATNERGEKVSSLAIEKTDELLALHTAVMKEMGDYFRYEVHSKMVADEEVSDTTLDWIQNYESQASYAHFWPHITIGYGEVKEKIKPQKFRASALGLFHLGNHCTCRKILFGIKL